MKKSKYYLTQLKLVKTRDNPKIFKEYLSLIRSVKTQHKELPNAKKDVVYVI